MMTENPTKLDTIVNLLAGGRSARLAELLNIHRSTVSGWKTEGRRPHGMCGMIPQKYHLDIIAIAERQGVDLPLSLLIPSSDQK